MGHDGNYIIVYYKKNNNHKAPLLKSTTLVIIYWRVVIDPLEIITSIICLLQDLKSLVIKSYNHRRFRIVIVLLNYKISC